ncbi:M56 family metallopeptidase [Schlesneria paludicola]|uniref:M56 family metallopeptidase n=1 Tax=Schlesneria paludicola TaxID=360056 RepID=UPI00029AFAFD|nr:M56 family metallopeptidase [Schlesneria paludicola]
MNGFWQTAQGVQTTSQEIFLSAETWIQLLLMASASATVLAVAVGMINLVFRRWLSSRQLSLMWGIVMIRLLMPFAPPSTWSLLNLLQADEVVQIQQVEIAPEPRRFFGSAENAELDVVRSQAATAAPAQSELASADMSIESSVFQLDFVVYLIFWSGMAIGFVQFARSIIIHIRFCRRVSSVPDCSDRRITTLWTECCRQARVLALPVKLTDDLVQPAILGAINPCLIVPQSILNLSDTQLRMVMFHELGHVRAWDVTMNWIMLGIRSLYWWNPLYWIAASRMERLREQACDAYAIRMIEGQPVRDYGELLLMLAQQYEMPSSWRVRLPASILGLFKNFFRRRTVENRLRALRFAGRKPTSVRHLGGITALGLLAICGLTDASIKVPKKAPVPLPGYEFDMESEWYAPHSGWCLDQNGVPSEGATVVRQYNLAQAIKQCAKYAGNLENAQRELQLMLIFRVRGSTGRYDSLPQDWTRERIKFEGDTVTVEAPILVQEDLAWEIAAWERNAANPQICMRLTFIGDDTRLDAVAGLTWRTLDSFSVGSDGSIISETTSGSPTIQTKSPPDLNLPIRVSTLTTAQVEQLRNQPGDTWNGPCITGFNGQRCRLFAGSQRPFVTGIGLKADDSRQPKIALIDEGFHFSCRSTEFNDHDHLKMEVTMGMTQIVDVKTASTLIHGSPAMIQVPSMKHWHMDVDANLQNDESLLIGCIPQFNEGRSFYVLLTKNKFREEQSSEHDK